MDDKEVSNRFGIQCKRKENDIKILDNLLQNEEFKEAVNKVREEMDNVAERTYSNTNWIQKLARDRYSEKYNLKPTPFSVGEWVFTSIKDAPKSETLGNNVYEIWS